jgi:predicted amidophosphoribosyltransferase
MSRTSPFSLDVPGECAGCGCQIEPGYRYCEPCADDVAREHYAYVERQRNQQRERVRRARTHVAREVRL